jgi:peptidoglycan-associated lipoprotein
VIGARVVSVVPVIVAASVLAACAHKTPPAAAPAPAPAAAPVAAAPVATPVAAPVDDGAARRRADALRAQLTQMTFFDFDQAELTGQDKATLDAKVPILAANPAVQIRVAGNCDDRGSDEYNLALGQRRAAASKRYLTEHGIDGARIATVSYGKERPIASGDTEPARTQNRNDQFEITAGGDALTLPTGT